MGVTSASPNDEAEDVRGVIPDGAGPESEAQRRSPSDAATQRFVAPVVGERCITCEAPLASDQRYCLNCGERRGRSRFSQLHGPAADATPSPPSPPVRPRRRLSSGATLVAGIATLLLAMGVGVEIGRLNNGGQQRASSPGVQVVTVGGSGGGGATGTAANPSSSSTTKGHAKVKAAKAQPKVVHITQKVQAQAATAAKKVLGSSAANLAPATVQPGQTCTHGAGCQGGKFTGNFFGP